ncbi:efflux RND transporter periplasmic adaptor subunit [Flavobacterium sp. CS20]|uniref:efflux RND transporter periplasmic adaptor subunit n=1 Tax=Flavobacterium sp. CS20 TaxID=2775246 RepID=UPI001B3A5383|nr:efflux RND transporter periplasmic adaptor subunit [Flavobacterium sp. CS20]QTY27156.1 efflux RND transporter periplasmic adaptor subunit [Flavobacterium sp. CS20]
MNIILNRVLPAVVLILMLGCSEKKETTNTNATKAGYKVNIFQVKGDTIGNQLSYNGTVEPKVSTPLSFLLPGVVTSIMVEEGDWVKKGQILAQIDNSSPLNTYNGTLATLNQAKDAYARLKSVYDKGSLPEIQMQDAISKLDQAKSVNLVALRNLENCTLRAPSSGFIGTRNVEVGSASIPGTPIFNLVSLNEVYVRISVPENEINSIKKNQKASVIIPALGSKVFMGNIEKVSVIANRLSKTYEVKILISNKDLLIKSGMACDVNINLMPSEGKLTIPYRAVIKDENGKNYVFKVNPESKKVSKQLVELGSFENNQIEVVSGLLKGDIIVTEGQHKLTDNDKVSY